MQPERKVFVSNFHLNFTVNKLQCLTDVASFVFAAHVEWRLVCSNFEQCLILVWMEMPRINVVYIKIKLIDLLKSKPTLTLNRIAICTNSSGNTFDGVNKGDNPVDTCSLRFFPFP